jgi:intracellular sulfur oxidation DsrE/DsrF family protein
VNDVNRLLALLCLAAMAMGRAAAADDPIAGLLSRDRPPPGVVFEIVTADPAALQWAVPQITRHVERLRQRFPQLDIAVVTHGREMFALMQEARSQAPEVHAGVERLARDEGVSVHVCGTYAEWRGVAAEAFPAYVNVAAAGPSQVQDFVALGYVRIVIREPTRGVRLE